MVMYFSYIAKAKNYDFKDTATNVYFALVKKQQNLAQ